MTISPGLHGLAARLVPLVLVVGSLATVAGPVPASAAEQPFRCDGGSVYLVQASGEIDRVSAATGVVAGSPVAVGSTGDDAGQAGALGVSTSGRAVDVVGSDLVEHGAGAAKEPVAGDVQDPVGGAVDPTSGVFYDGSFRGSALVLHGYDLTSHTAFGPAARVKVPGAPGKDGDFAFDTAGHLYVVASSKKKATLYVASLHLPTSGSSAVTATAVKVRTSTVAGPVTGLAFASDGFLYTSTADTLQRLNPVSGRLAAATSLGADVEATDLGSCAVPSLLSVRTNLPDGRVRGRDQFHATIRSAEIDQLPRAARPVGTSSGSEKGVQDQRPSEVAGPTAVLPGQTYAVASVGAGKTDERRYVSSYSCLQDGAGGRVLAEGATASGSVVVPATVAAVVVCTVTHSAPAPALGVTQKTTPTTVDHVGELVTFSATVTNTGNVALDGLKVADSLPGLAARTCTPTAVGGTLAVGAITTCTTTSTVTQADLDAPAPRSDRVSVSAVTTKRLGAVRATATTETAVTVKAAPALAVTVTTVPTAVARTGQPISYTVTVHNAGNQTLRDVVATAVAPDLPALTCAPIAQGGTLAPGVTTVCTATRSSSQADLLAGGTTVSASAGALSPSGTSVATSTAKTGVSSLPPKATDDAVDVLFGTRSVTLPASTNDSPAEPGGPAIDVSRTVFPLSEGGNTVLKVVDGHYGIFQVLHDGSVRYLVDTRFSTPPVDGWTETVRYRTFDAAGRSADATLRITFHRGLTARPDTVTGLQGDRSVATPLHNDSPGEGVDGTRATLDQASLAFTPAQPEGTAIVSGPGHALSILYTGTFSVFDGTVAFDPDPLWSGSVAVRYQVRDSLGNTSSSTVTFTATPVVPKPADDSVSTPYDKPVTLAGATNDAAGAPGRVVEFAGFVGRDGAGTGATLDSPQGTWSCPVGGPPARVTFAPAPGFVGVATASYTAQTSRGGTAVGQLKVTVQPGTPMPPPVAHGATAVNDALTRPQVAYSLRVDPLANDRPGQNADGTLGTLDLTTVRFPSAGQPQGAQVVDDGRALLLPRYGASPGLQLAIDPDSGLISIYPPPRFRGTLPAIRYTVQSETTGSTGVAARETVGAALQVRLVGRDPVATNDSVTVASGQGVSLPGPSNDIPASRDEPIDIYSGTFPVSQVTDLPKGSKVDFHGEFSRSWWEATVPGQGYWQIYWSDPHVTFTPVPGFQGTTSPVRYEITDAVGNHADGLVSVKVLPPAVVRDDVVSTTQGVGVSVNVLANDTPARNPDGTPVIDFIGPYFSSDSAQPKGAVLNGDGQLTVPGEGTYSVELQTGLVTFQPLPTFSGTASRVTLRFGNQESTLRVKVTTVKPVAAADSVTAKAGVPLRIPVLDNDAPGTASRPLVRSSLRLRSTSGLPAGSALSKDGQVLAIPGRGVFGVAGDGSITYYSLPGVVGTLPPVSYTVADVNQTSATSTVTVKVAR